MNMFRSNHHDASRNAAPHFPIYLLPTLKIPFVKRRRSSLTTTTASNDVPSLSSSPTSTAGTDGFPSSPTSPSGIEAYTLNLPEDEQFSKAPQHQQVNQQHPPKPRRVSHSDRLTRNLPDILRCNTCGTDVAYGLQIVSKGFTGRHGRALLVAAPPPTATPSCPGSPLSTGPPQPTNANSYTSLARDGANLVNVKVGRPEPRALVTGAHVVADITCATCGAKIGWKYVDAREQAQKYKVGKFILETERVVLHRTWEDVLAGGGEEEVPGHFYSSSAPAGSSARGGRKVSCSSEGSGSLEDGGGSSDESEGEIAFDSDDEDECEDIFAGVWDAATVARRRGSKVGRGSYSRAGRKNRGGR
ncbi:hypothetical protein VP1G_05843 [Cytospora mali]|uniref:Yippee domain-containing protein n=1 Tax=Cytospora mali TaxID=578113 RepID=A0A194V3J8_CYTMA|nr:hypothetical protein VP1G_05843 [Valsa mali var. pyri (nom. inval.)]